MNAFTRTVELLTCTMTTGTTPERETAAFRLYALGIRSENVMRILRGDF